MTNIYDIQNKKYPNKIINLLIKDKRLENVDGHITPYNQCKYKDSKEIKQYGYNMSYITNLDDFIPCTGGLSFWLEEDNDYIFIKQHIVPKDVIQIKKDNIEKIINYIVSIIIKKSFKSNLKERVV